MSGISTNTAAFLIGLMQDHYQEWLNERPLRYSVSDQTIARLCESFLIHAIPVAQRNPGWKGGISEMKATGLISASDALFSVSD